MVSLLHKSQLRLDSGSGATAIEESCNDYRKPSRRSPVSGRRILGLGQGMKTLAAPSDRVPKRFRKKRCNEIHPLLRRSVCTLILAGAGLLTGISILVVDHYLYGEISKSGIIVLSISLCFIILGITWLCWSTAQLRKLKEKILEKQAEREIRQVKAVGADQFYANRPAHDPAALSATKWPVKPVLPEDAERTCTDGATFECEVPYKFPVTSRNSKQFNKFPTNMSGTSLMSENDSVFTRDISNMALYGQKSIESDLTSTGSGQVPQIYVTGCNTDQKSDDLTTQRTTKTEHIEMREI